jgi:serine protease
MMSLKKIFFLFSLSAFSLMGCSSSNNSSAPAAAPATESPGSVPATPGFTLSGRILVASNTTKDDDVNDVNAADLPNNNPFIAQTIPNPMILGGYANEAGAGPKGRFKISGDSDDFFEVELRAGQVIFLFVANENLTGTDFFDAGNDLDLGLLDDQGTLLDASVGEGQTESLVVPRDGHYFIQVQAHTGASNYVLTVGQNISTTSHGMRLSDSFAVGQVQVEFAPNHRKQAQSMLTSLGMQTHHFNSERRTLFTYEPSRFRPLSTENLKFATPNLRAKYETLMAIKALRKQDHIVEASPNYQLQAFRVPNDALYDYQWNHSSMSLPQAWDMTIGDPSVTVAVIDTGVLLDHPDLQGQFVHGFDFISNPNIEVDNDGGIDSNPNDPGDKVSPGGSSFHGSHVSGIIAAATNNGEGIAGVAWLTKIMPLRTLGQGGMGFDYDIEQAMRYAAALPNDSGTLPAEPADIINVSLGGPAISPGFQRLVNQVREAGVIVVAASGNENTNQAMYPASLDGVVSVGSVDINNRRASYSNYGPTLDVVAPGGDSTPDVNGDGMPDGILSTIGDDQLSRLDFAYSSMEGTSMASPHVAGVISLMRTANPNLMPVDFDNLLKSGRITDDLGRSGRDDEFGYGLINAQKAVLAALELGPGTIPEVEPFLTVTPKSLNFGLSQTRLSLRLNNNGSGNLLIENITENSGGFLLIEGNGLGDYLVRLNRGNSRAGTYTATITIITNTNRVQIPVIWQVGDPNSTGDAGLHYILLIEPNTLETVTQTKAAIQNGVYSFRFENVPTGTYIIVAGTDFNNDGFICDLGEACGFFPTSEHPTPIEVNNDRNSLDFSSGFNVNFLSQQSTNVKSQYQRGFARLKENNKELRTK